MKHLLLSLLLTASAVAQGSITLEKFYGETCDQAFDRLSTEIDENYRAGVEQLNEHYKGLIDESMETHNVELRNYKKIRDAALQLLADRMALESATLGAQLALKEITEEEFAKQLEFLRNKLAEDAKRVVWDFHYGANTAQHNHNVREAEIEAARLKALQAAEDAYHAQLRDLYLWRRNCTG